jgi:hypothetical protein
MKECPNCTQWIQNIKTANRNFAEKLQLLTIVAASSPKKNHMSLYQEPQSIQLISTVIPAEKMEYVHSQPPM